MDPELPKNPMLLEELLAPKRPQVDPTAALIGKIATFVIMGALTSIVAAAALGVAVRVFLFCAGF